MVIRRCVAICLACLVANVIATDVQAGPGKTSQKFILYLSCVDAAASVALEKGHPVKPSIGFGVKSCKRRLDGYVQELISKAKKKHNWRSVQPSVRPAVEAEVVKQIYAKLTPVYKAYLR